MELIVPKSLAYRIPAQYAGDNGAAWASNFELYSLELEVDFEKIKKYCREYLEREFAVFFKISEFVKGAYALNINPLPQLRRDYNTFEFSFQKMWTLKTGMHNSIHIGLHYVLNVSHTGLKGAVVIAKK